MSGAIFYAYLLLDPMNYYLPFYAGKGKGRRAYRHNCNYAIRDDKNFLRRKILISLQKNNLKATIYIWAEKLIEEQAFDKEIELIKRFGRRDKGTGILTNLTDGGEGFSSINLSASNRKRWRNPIMRAKLVRSMRLAQTKEVRIRKSEAVKEVWSDQEYKEARIEKRSGKIIIEEKNCEFCGDMFLVTYRDRPSKKQTIQKNRRFCGRSCSSKNNVRIMAQKNAEQ